MIQPDFDQDINRPALKASLEQAQRALHSSTLPIAISAPDIGNSLVLAIFRWVARVTALHRDTHRLKAELLDSSEYTNQGFAIRSGIEAEAATLADKLVHIQHQAVEHLSQGLSYLLFRGQWTLFFTANWKTKTYA